MYILGVSAFYHDAAAALIKDGKIIAASQEERFTRIKHDAALPFHSIDYCLKEENLTPDKLDCVVFYDNSLLTLDRYMKNILNLGEDAKDLIEWNHVNMFGKRLWIHKLLQSFIPSLGKKTKFLVVKHHISHAAAAFYPSPFNDSVILTIDGVGEWSTLTIGIGHNNHITLKEEIRYPNSLGLFYSAMAYFCGFKVNSGEYKFMGLAPYGKPIYKDLIKKNLIDIKEDGSFRLNMDYFDYYKGKTMINEELMSKLFGKNRRFPEEHITKLDMDIAASVQNVLEETILKIARHAKKKYGDNTNNLVMAGGVALNCVSNGMLQRSHIFENIWIQPAAGDAGSALGAALYAYYEMYGKRRNIKTNEDSQQGSFLGIEFNDFEIKKFLDKNGYIYEQMGDDYFKIIAKLLVEEKIIGIFSGRMEFGPRALGNRSIIADPRLSGMQVKLNQKIKYRESFRPFAPAVLQERVEDYFEFIGKSPYMLFCADVKSERRLPFDLDNVLQSNDMDMLNAVSIPRSDIPAVTHVDYSARLQTVSQDENPHFYAIIKAFESLTGCGLIINTSFNLRGEPIVCTPMDAYRCFMRSSMDILALGNFLLYKESQPIWEENLDWRKNYELD